MYHPQPTRATPPYGLSDEEDYEFVDVPYTRALPRSKDQRTRPEPTHEPKMNRSNPLICLDSDEEAESKFRRQPDKTETRSCHRHQASLLDADHKKQARDTYNKKEDEGSGNNASDENDGILSGSLSKFVGQVDKIQATRAASPLSPKNSNRASSTVARESERPGKYLNHPLISPYDQGDFVSDPIDQPEVYGRSKPHPMNSLQEDTAHTSAAPNDQVDMLANLKEHEVRAVEEEVGDVEDYLREASPENDFVGIPGTQSSVGSVQQLDQVGEARRQSSEELGAFDNPTDSQITTRTVNLDESFEHQEESTAMKQAPMTGSGEQVDDDLGNSLEESVAASDLTGSQTTSHTVNFYQSFHHQEGSIAMEEALMMGTEEQLENASSEYPQEPGSVESQTNSQMASGAEIHGELPDYEEPDISNAPEIRTSAFVEGHLNEYLDASLESTLATGIFPEAMPLQLISRAESVEGSSQDPQEPAEGSNNESQELEGQSDEVDVATGDEKHKGHVSCPDSPQISETGDNGTDFHSHSTSDVDQARRAAEIHDMVSSVTDSPAQNFTSLSTVILRRLGEMSDAELWDAFCSIFGHNTQPPIESSHAESSFAKSLYNKATQTESDDANADAVADANVDAESCSPEVSAANVPRKLQPVLERLNGDSCILILVFTCVAILLNGLTFFWVSLLGQ